MHTRMHTHMHTRLMHTRMHRHMHAYMHTESYIHANLAVLPVFTAKSGFRAAGALIGVI